MNLTFYALSDIGRVRKENQDNYLVIKYQDSFMAGVFDGVGGCDDGKFAALIAKENTEKCFLSGDVLDSSDIFNIGKRMEGCLININKELMEKGYQCSSSFYTTASIICFFKENYYISHIGDCKIYLLRDGDFFKLTKDDNLGEIKGKEYSNVLTQALGDKEHIEIHSSFETYFKDDIFLLCSDGLTAYLEEKELKHIISTETNLDDAVIKMIGLAGSRGGSDNITAVLLKVN